MAIPIGIASFPGVRQVVSCTYTLSHGISPSVATLTIAPQADFVGSGGPLVFAYAGVKLVFPDCKVDKHSFRRNANGDIWTFQIVDRRWKWAFGEISGHYNERLPDGSTIDNPPKVTTLAGPTILPLLADGAPILKATQLAPPALAALCLEAMGEVGYDVSQMPDDLRPEVRWEAENPAQALASLAEQVGCRVVLRLDGTVQVARTGVGANLPGGLDILEDSLTIDPPEVPDYITFVAGPTRFQVDLLLEAVGRDVDGTIRKIDDLSYKPAAGWQTSNPPYFTTVPSNLDNVPRTRLVPNPVSRIDERRNPRSLARATVFRWYRPSMKDADASNKAVFIPGIGRVGYLRQILPLESEQVRTVKDHFGQLENLPARVMGRFWVTTDPRVINSDLDEEYTGGFQILADEGIVEFAEPVFKFDSSGRPIAAELFLRTAFTVRDYRTNAPLRYRKSIALGGGAFGTKAKILRHDEVRLGQYSTYRLSPSQHKHTIDDTRDNKEEVDRQADHYLQAALAAYQTDMPREVVYAGLKPISPDGAIQQVTWEVGPQGAITRAGRNNEFSKIVPSYQERRAAEKLGQEISLNLIDAVKQLRAKRQGAKGKKP